VPWRVPPPGAVGLLSIRHPLASTGSTRGAIGPAPAHHAAPEARRTPVHRTSCSHALPSTTWEPSGVPPEAVCNGRRPPTGRRRAVAGGRPREMRRRIRRGSTMLFDRRGGRTEGHCGRRGRHGPANRRVDPRPPTPGPAPYPGQLAVGAAVPRTDRRGRRVESAEPTRRPVASTCPGGRGAAARRVRDALYGPGRGGRPPRVHAVPAAADRCVELESASRHLQDDDRDAPPVSPRSAPDVDTARLPRRGHRLCGRSSRGHRRTAAAPRGSGTRDGAAGGTAWRLGKQPPRVAGRVRVTVRTRARASGTAAPVGLCPALGSPYRWRPARNSRPDTEHRP
jgi:hypothetical protein